MMTSSWWRHYRDFQWRHYLSMTSLTLENLRLRAQWTLIIAQNVSTTAAMQHSNDVIKTSLWRQSSDVMTSLWRHYNDVIISLLWRHKPFTNPILQGPKPKVVRFQCRHYLTVTPYWWCHYLTVTSSLWRHYLIMTSFHPCWWRHYPGMTSLPQPKSCLWCQNLNKSSVYDALLFYLLWWRHYPVMTSCLWRWTRVYDVIFSVLMTSLPCYDVSN
jgi:hypothetical protein